MQKTLSNFAQPSAQKVRKHGEQRLYYCVNCVLNSNSEDAKKYHARYVKRQVRVVLEPITPTMLICPRCGAQHFSRDFNGNKCKHYKNL